MYMRGIKEYAPKAPKGPGLFGAFCTEKTRSLWCLWCCFVENYLKTTCQVKKYYDIIKKIKAYEGVRNMRFKSLNSIFTYTESVINKKSRINKIENINKSIMSKS